MTRFPLYLLLGALCLSSCNHIHRWFGNESDRVAQIDKDILYRKDLETMVPSGLEPTDSINVTSRYIDSWAIDHLLLKKAESELSKEEKDVNKELEDYRRSLIVFRYQKKYVEERIDTAIRESEIEAYYTGNPEQFRLEVPLCKARLIKMGLQSPNLPLVRTLYRDHTMENLAQLEDICNSSAEVYTNFADEWINPSQLAQDLPMTADAIKHELKPDGFIDTHDSLYVYLVSVAAYVPDGDISPMEYKKNNIRQIILSKRKQDLLKNLETEVLKEGWNTQQIKIYNKKNDE